MKIDFGQELKTIEGETLQRNRQKDGVIIQEPATLRWAAVEALLTASQEKMPADEKGRRYELALKIQNTDAATEMSVDDLSFIKKVCDEHFGPLVMGQTRKMLEGETETEKKSG